MTNKELAEIYDLRKQGYSIRDIADELGITKSSVERALKTDLNGLFGDDAPPAPAPVSGRQTMSSSANGELGMLNIRLAHEREMRQLDLKKQELEIEREKLRVRERETENQRRLLDIGSTEIGRKQGAIDERLTKRKEQLVDKFNRIIDELLENSQDSTWKASEIQDLIDRAEAIQDKVTAFCKKNDIDEDDLALSVRLSLLVNYLDTLIDGKSKSDYITIDNDEDEDAQIERYRVDSFDDELDDEDEDEMRAVAPVAKTDLAGTDEELDGTDDEDEKGGSGWGTALAVAGGLAGLALLSKK